MFDDNLNGFPNMGHFTDREIIQPPYEQRIEFIEHGTDTPMPPLCHQLTDIGEEFAPSLMSGCTTHVYNYKINIFLAFCCF